MTFDWARFHRLWGEAKDSPTYDKASWGQMQLELEQMERDLNEYEVVRREIHKHGPQFLRALLHTLRYSQ